MAKKNSTVKSNAVSNAAAATGKVNPKKKEGKEPTKKNKSSKNTPDLSKPKTISGYTIMPVRIENPVELNSPNPHYTHYLYFKRQEQKSDEMDEKVNRTLFVINIPNFATEESLRQIFLEFGSVESVNFGFIKTNTNTKATQFSATWLPTDIANSSRCFAHVVYTMEESIQRVFAIDPQKNRILGAHKETLGVDAWLEKYLNASPSLISLQKRVDSFMGEYEANEIRMKEELARQAGQADEDGFVIVTRLNRRNRNVNEGAIATASRPIEIKNLKPKDKELLDFYRFQMRQTKIDEIADLRRKFEADKARIQQMKEARRFRPY